MTDREALLQCYLSGQMSAAQFERHCEDDPELRKMVEAPKSDGLNAAAKIIAAEILNTAWDSLNSESVEPKGYPVFLWSGFGGRRFQGGHDDLRNLARKIVEAYLHVAARTALRKWEEPAQDDSGLPTAEDVRGILK